MLTNAEMEAFAELLVSWLERDLRAGKVRNAEGLRTERREPAVPLRS